jgi:hypothetical protein
VNVEDPSGRAWRVKRRWLPWRLRRRDPSDFVDFSGGDFSPDDLVIGLAIFVGMVIVVVLVPFVAVLAIVVAEIFVLLLLLPLFVVLRAAFVARWPIETWRGDQLVHAEAVRGWSDSHRRMVEIVDGIRLGKGPHGASPTA